MHPLLDTGFPQTLGAPQWMIIALRTLGFGLHAAFMGLWYAGLPLAIVLATSRDLRLRQISRRLMLQMPVVIAFGVNLGIVPLLFLQVGFAGPFYSATILMGWFWLAIIALLIPAYYGIYAYGWDGIPLDSPVRGWRLWVGLASACFFVVMGFIFANAFSFVFRVERWSALWNRAQLAGAATGLNLNIDDPAFWPRWLVIFALAVQTTACWFVLDMLVLRRTAAVEDRALALRFAKNLYIPAAIAMVILGIWHLSYLPKSLEVVMGFPGLPATALAIVLPVVLSVLFIRSAHRAGEVRPATAWLFVGLHLLAIISVGFIRILADLAHIELLHSYGFWTRPVNMQWSPFMLFAVTLVAGACVFAWMIFQVLKHLQPADESQVHRSIELNQSGQLS